MLFVPVAAIMISIAPPPDPKKFLDMPALGALALAMLFGLMFCLLNVIVLVHKGLTRSRRRRGRSPRAGILGKRQNTVNHDALVDIEGNIPQCNVILLRD